MFTALARLQPRLAPFRQSLQFLHVTQVNPAARKGTRERKNKKKVKVEIEKVGFIPHNLRKKKAPTADKHIDDSWKAIPTDNVYPGRYYRWRLYPITEAIEAFREAHHPTMYDTPDAPINMTIEMNMQGEKQTRFVSNFTKITMIEHAFDHGEERKILALAKEEETVRECQEVGAALAGGVEIIKDIQIGKVSLNDFQFVVAHPSILPELVAIRGLLKKKFPNPKNETLGLDVPALVKRYLTGISYKATKDISQENFGTVSICMGTLKMPTEHLKANCLALLKDVNQLRPKRAGKFITRVIVTSPPAREALKIDPADFPFEDWEGTRVGGKKRGKASKQKDAVAEEDEETEEEPQVKQDVAT